MGAVFDHKAWAGQSGPVYGDLAVGDITQLKVDGVLTDFIVVHQGNPSSAIYDASCDGTWLLAKEIYTLREFDDVENGYNTSGIHYYLNGVRPSYFGSFIDLLSSKAQNLIKEVKIPYYNAGDYYTKERGVAAKIFLLSNAELNLTTYGNSDISTEGTKLDYFDSEYSAKPLAYYNGAVTFYWLRSGRKNYPAYAAYVYSRNDRTYGTIASSTYTNTLTMSNGVRPCMIMPSNQKIIS